MTAAQLKLGTADPVLGQMGEALLAEEMRGDPLLEARCPGILRDQLPPPSGRVGTVPPRCQERGRPLAALAVSLRRQRAPAAAREQPLPILVALPLDQPQLARGQVDVREAEWHECGLPHPRHEEPWEPDPVGEGLCGPPRGRECHSCRLRP